MKSRLSFLTAAAEDAVYELWRGELGFAEAEKLAFEVKAVQTEIRTLRTRLSVTTELAAAPPTARCGSDSRLRPGNG